MVAMVVWVDNRLYALRTAFAANSKRLVAQVVASFDTVAKEYRRVIQVCDAQRWRARDSLVSSGSGSTTSSSASAGSAGPRNGKGPDSKKNFGIILRGIPKIGDKPICFHNLSAKQCKVKDCKRSHDLPLATSIKGDVLVAFKALYGPLRSDLP